MSLSREFASFVAGLRYEDLPPEVVDRAKELQALTSALIGRNMPASRQALALMQEEEAGSVGFGPAWSALGDTWGIADDTPALLAKVVEALRSGGATEEVIAAAIKADGEVRTPQRSKWTACKRRQRAAIVRRDSRQRANPVPRDEADDVALRRQLLHAAHGNVDPWADLAPIRALLDQGCSQPEPRAPGGATWG
jgi:hypothetical protein